MSYAGKEDRLRATDGLFSGVPVVSTTCWVLGMLRVELNASNNNNLWRVRHLCQVEEKRRIHLSVCLADKLHKLSTDLLQIKIPEAEDDEDW